MLEVRYVAAHSVLYTKFPRTQAYTDWQNYTIHQTSILFPHDPISLCQYMEVMQQALVYKPIHQTKTERKWRNHTGFPGVCVCLHPPS